MIILNAGITDQGNTAERGSLAYMISKDRTFEGTVKLREGNTYYFYTDLTIPSTYEIRVPNGAKMDGTATVTFDGARLDAGPYPIFKSGLTIAGQIRAQNIFPDWWEEG